MDQSLYYGPFWPTLILVLISLTVIAHSGWVDPDTPEEFFSTVSLVDGRTYELVGSDEFSVTGRKFAPGEDSMWTGIDHSDDSNTGGALSLGNQQYYNSTMLTTNDGYLNITTTSDTTLWLGWNPYMKHYQQMNKTFRSGMVSGWNKFCFTGGKIEINAKLPGKATTGGLWPAIWMLGNLGKPTFESSTNLVWPWSYDKCNMDLIEAQEISACKNTHHYGMQQNKGRGSTEIDIIEVMAGQEKDISGTSISMPYFSSTLQVAPGITKNRPNFGVPPEPDQTWYRGMEYGSNSTQNVFFYGSNMGATSVSDPNVRTLKQSYRADSISAITNVETDLFDNFHKYGLEWVTGDEGYLRWYLDDKLLFSVDASALAVTGAQIPREPSYIILNTAVSSAWGFPLPCPEGCDCSCFDCKDAACTCGLPVGFCEMLPAHFLIDYVRVYQAVNDSTQYTGCDPVSHPTRRFMKAHKDRYTSKTFEPLTMRLHQGGGKCKEDKECGHGTCGGIPFYHWCTCEEGWWGPNCLVTKKFEESPTAWQVGNTLDFYAPDLPFPLMVALVALVIGSVFAVFINVKDKRRSRIRR